jgi:hypothetical protein
MVSWTDARFNWQWITDNWQLADARRNFRPFVRLSFRPLYPSLLSESGVTGLQDEQDVLVNCITALLCICLHSVRNVSLGRKKGSIPLPAFRRNANNFLSFRLCLSGCIPNGMQNKEATNSFLPSDSFRWNESSLSLSGQLRAKKNCPYNNNVILAGLKNPNRDDIIIAKQRTFPFTKRRRCDIINPYLKRYHPNTNRESQPIMRQ